MRLFNVSIPSSSLRPSQPLGPGHERGEHCVTLTERLGKRLPIAVDYDSLSFPLHLGRGVHARGSREMREARAPHPSRDFSHARG